MSVEPSRRNDFSREVPELIPVEKMGLKELEKLRLILRGGSVIDWRRLYMDDRAEVDRFLKLHLLDPANADDHARIDRILKESVEYLRTTFRYRVAEAVAAPKNIEELFLFASGQHPKNPDRYRKIACLVLKLMHVIHHLEGRELLFRTPVAEAVLAKMVQDRVLAIGSQLVRPGGVVTSFTGNVKTRESIITKLIAKKETVAAQIFDKVRYRIVTREKKDILPVLEYLSRTLFPFNLVVPSQTENTLVSFRKVMERTPELRKHIEDLHLPLRHEADERRREGKGNPFSGNTYQVLNFIVDLPVRIDPYLTPEDRAPGRPKSVFVLVEFQLVDEVTAADNERGDNSHERYKHRQKLKVLRRLSRGLVVPKKPGEPPKA